MTTSTYIPVGRYTDEYCKALTENYKRDSMRSLEYNLKKDPTCTYSKDQLAKIVSGTAKLDKFRYYEGKKYIKVVREEYDEREDRWRDTTVHSFVDKKTGDVYKPASWKAPAKHVRFSFCNKKDLLFLTDPRCVGWAGGYLYMLSLIHI